MLKNNQGGKNNVYYYYFLSIVASSFAVCHCQLNTDGYTKKSGVLYKHNHTIPVGATYTSKKHNQAFSSINNKNRVSFPETIDGDEYYFCQNKYVFNNNSWQSILIRDSKNVLLEINGYNVLTKK